MGATQSTNHAYTLSTPLGRLQGIEQRDKLGNPVCHRYVKVPYARPPIGQFRWRRPQSLPESFSFNSPSGAPGDYTSFGPICPQPYYPLDAVHVDDPTAAAPIDNVESEDCLYLNIWVPASPPPPGGWPVQFHIHGGWLQMGNALQAHDEDPFDLLASSTPRIIISPTYRLNLFGFLAGADLANCAEDPAPSNYGFWDQRCALEWTAKHISLFSGNPSNITVGGLSAGANSTFFQLYYDSHLPASQRLIKRIYLWSNAVAIQPAPTTSPNLTSQFDDLCAAHSIPTNLPPVEKLSRLRSIPASELITSLAKLTRHTFRGSTDGDFIPPSFLSSLHDGTFTTLLANHNISVLLGEVRDEYQLYKLVNPPHDHATLITQLKNYYPEPVVAALINPANNLYTLPSSSSTDSDAWATTFAKIVADVQVHASSRSFTNLLLNPPISSTTKNEIIPLPPQNVHRYRICWRAKSLDAYLKPEYGMFHASDTPIWWLSGYRMAWSDSDKQAARTFLAPFGKFLYGNAVPWGQRDAGGNAGEEVDSSKAEGANEKSPAGGLRLRLLDEDGVTHEDVEDQEWERCMRIAEVVWGAQWDAAEEARTGEKGELRL